MVRYFLVLNLPLVLFQVQLTQTKKDTHTENYLFYRRFNGLVDHQLLIYTRYPLTCVQTNERASRSRRNGGRLLHQRRQTNSYNYYYERASIPNVYAGMQEREKREARRCVQAPGAGVSSATTALARGV